MCDSAALAGDVVVCTKVFHGISMCTCRVLNLATCCVGGFNAGAQQGLMSKLQQVVASNRLEAFYPPQKLQQTVDRLQRVDFRCGFLVSQTSSERRFLLLCCC